MAPREEEVRTALEMFPINILRRLIDERDISFSSRRSDQLIERLIDDGWDEEEFDELTTRLANIKLETERYSRYIVDLDAIAGGLDQDQPEHGRVQSLLETNSAEFDDFNDLLEEGFEISSVDTNSVEGIHWTESINYSLSPMDEIKKQQTLYETGFHIDLDEEVVFIDCNLPAKASSLIGEFDQLGIQTTDVGHDNFSNTRANELVQGFVDEFNERLRDDDPQTALDDSDSPPVLEIDLVNMLLDDANLRDVKIGGRTDIIENPEVRRFRDEHDSRIVRLEGEFHLDNNWYRFTTGYTEGMGQVSVKKKGRVEERPELVEEAFHYLYDSYKEYFIEI